MTKETKQSGEPVSTETNIPKERHDLRILQSLRRIIRAVDMHSRKLAAKYNITGPQLISLLTIAESGPITVAAVGKKIHLSASTMVGILDRLESKGFITRHRGHADRRQVYVQATDAGIKFIKDAPSPLHDKLMASLNTLPDLEQATIALSLERVVELMELGEEDASPILEAGPLNLQKS